MGAGYALLDAVLESMLENTNAGLGVLYCFFSQAVALALSDGGVFRYATCKPPFLPEHRERLLNHGVEGAFLIAFVN